MQQDRHDADREIVIRLESALRAAAEVARQYASRDLEVAYKIGDDPVTAADDEINRLLLERLPRGGEGWFSEETADDLSRLDREAVWVVDPIDGTREFVTGIPEWCVSVGYVRGGRAVAGGVCNPATGELIVGSLTTGVTYNGRPTRVTARERLAGAVILASRSEVKRGEWERFKGAEFTVRPMGSAAYKLGLVAAGRADATWTLVPKHEWDVAAGVALVEAAGGFARGLREPSVSFNQKDPLLSGLAAGAAALRPAIEAALGLY